MTPVHTSIRYDSEIIKKNMLTTRIHHLVGSKSNIYGKGVLITKIRHHVERPEISKTDPNFKTKIERPKIITPNTIKPNQSYKPKTVKTVKPLTGKNTRHMTSPNNMFRALVTSNRYGRRNQPRPNE